MSRLIQNHFLATLQKLAFVASLCLPAFSYADKSQSSEQNKTLVSAYEQGNVDEDKKLHAAGVDNSEPIPESKQVVHDTAACYKSMVGTFKVVKKHNARSRRETDDRLIKVSQNGSTYSVSAFEADGKIVLNNYGRPNATEAQPIDQELLRLSFVGKEDDPSIEEHWRSIDACGLASEYGYLVRAADKGNTSYIWSGGSVFGSGTTMLEAVK